MKETDFIAQNKDKWRRFEKLSEDDTRNPEELANLYMDITDDLSYAQTFYKRRTVRVYLNQLAQRVFTGLHKQKAESLKKIVSVWTVSLPLEIYRSRKNIQFTLVVFSIWMLLGAVTTHMYPDFAETVLGSSYVSQTNANIEAGKALKIYEDEHQLNMFITITTNNLRVAFLCFILGVFFTIGTHIILFSNGVMVGVFQYYFATKGLLLTTFLGIWIHGAFEISAIVLAGAAGITLGNGFLFPKSYTRLQSMQLAAKRSIKLMLSLVPFIILAGFLESYVTHNYQDLPDWSKWTLILLSFGIIFFYYMLYPILVARKHPELVDQEEVVNFFPQSKFELYKIRTVFECIADSFRFYRLNFAKIFKPIFQFILPISMVLLYVQHQNHPELMERQHFFDWATQFSVIFGSVNKNAIDVGVVFCWWILISAMIASVLYAFASLEKAFAWNAFFAFLKTRFLRILVGVSFFYFTVIYLPWQLYFILFFLLPLIYLNPFVVGIDSIALKSSFKLAWKYSVSSYGNSLLALIMSLVLLVLFMQPIAFVGSIHGSNTPENIFNITEPPVRDLLDILADFTKRVAVQLEVNPLYWSNFMRQLVYLLFALFILPLIFILPSFLSYSAHEKWNALGLRKKLETFGKKQRTKETELDFEE